MLLKAGSRILAITGQLLARSLLELEMLWCQLNAGLDISYSADKCVRSCHLHTLTPRPGNSFIHSTPMPSG